MAKNLSEMTLEELWQLFPIYLTEHKEYWKEWYIEEKRILESFLPNEAIIHHIGSTSIEGIWAKPIVDILIEVPKTTNYENIKESFASNGYICMCSDEKRVSFNKGYTNEGFAERVFHLHVRFYGDNNEILFRDYLNKHKDIAKEYEQLKLKLWKKFEHDRDGYTDAKTDFILRCMQKARCEV